MLFAERQRFSLAAMFFALATTFRANGILLSGYIIWGMIVLPLIQCRKVNEPHDNIFICDLTAISTFR